MQASRSRVLATMGAVLAAVCGVVLAPSPTMAATTSSRAFSLSASGTAEFINPTTASFTGTGQSNLLGAVKVNGQAVITGVSITCPGGLVNDNVQTYTTASGATLSITSKDVGCITATGAMRGDGTWTVTSATGALTGVHGYGTIDGHANFVTKTFAYAASGTLVYP